MATLTTIVKGTVADGIDSDALPITDEAFTSVFDVPVKLANMNLTAASSVVTSLDGLTTYTEGAGDDYTMSNLGGYITVLSTGSMADATGYLIDYTFRYPTLAARVNAVTTVAQAAGKDYTVTTSTRGKLGVAVIVTEV